MFPVREESNAIQHAHMGGYLSVLTPPLKMQDWPAVNEK
jgi:hypothetical protein